MRLKYLIPALLTLVLTIPSFAVTDKEMEEARTITAKLYLRYANDGSGYLDDVKATNMRDLTAKLKEKEKENLKAFNQVKVPSDYASWDKEKLTEFWGVTFFTSPALSDKGKVAKSRVRKQIAAMNIAAPAAAPKEVETPEPPTPTDIPAAAEAPADAQAAPAAETAAQEQQDILADQEAIEKDNEQAENHTNNESSSTWVYVVVLVILIAIVIWLVVMAANMMKKRPDEDVPTEEDNNDLRKKAHDALVKKNEEIDELKRRLNLEENNNADISAQLERLKLENSRLSEQVENLRAENLRLSTAPAPAPAPARAPERVAPSAPQVAEDQAPKQAPREFLKVIYLGRANSRGIFVRADRHYSAGNTIFRLDTNDGLVGTFRLTDAPDTLDLALSNPGQYLAGAAIAEDLDDTVGVENIATESAGTAIFENGYWRVLRKTKIRYE